MIAELDACHFPPSTGEQIDSSFLALFLRSITAKAHQHGVSANVVGPVKGDRSSPTSKQIFWSEREKVGASYRRSLLSTLWNPPAALCVRQLCVCDSHVGRSIQQ
jgi:hypothetical protein